jgi:DNA-binding MarR family transcriptional regulator
MATRLISIDRWRLVKDGKAMSRVPPEPSFSSDRALAVRVVRHAHRLLAGRLEVSLHSTPEWDMLLDLYVRGEHRSISLTGLCGASRTPERTALRAIETLVMHDYLRKARDDRDRRRTNVFLTPDAVCTLDAFFDEVAVMLGDAVIAPRAAPFCAGPSMGDGTRRLDGESSTCDGYRAIGQG